MDPDEGTGVIDWPALHQQVVETFAVGWDRPHPHAWDDLLADDVELVQPMLRRGRGRDLWWDESRRLLAFLPDLRADVMNWAGKEDQLFIELRLSATLGGRPLAFRAVDQLLLTPAGIVVRRESVFDSAPLAQAVLRRPGSWLAWWRSGIGPLLGRRRLLRA